MNDGTDHFLTPRNLWVIAVTYVDARFMPEIPANQPVAQLIKNRVIVGFSDL
jgi:hypothetical protein